MRLCRCTYAALVAAMLVLALSGCSTPAVSSSVDAAGDAVEPARWNLATPESAVRSYLDWVSFSYRMANSEVATATMTPDESVRVDSYIELNRQKGQGIEQTLESFEVRSATRNGETAVVTAQETWRYRYFSLGTLAYVSETLAASYDTTYTVIRQDGGWVVDRVEAAAEGKVQ